MANWRTGPNPAFHHGSALPEAAFLWCSVLPLKHGLRLLPEIRHTLAQRWDRGLAAAKWGLARRLPRFPSCALPDPAQRAPT